MSAFEAVFANAKEQLDQVLQKHVSERHHIQRCLTLAEMIEWHQSNVGNEFGQMLGGKGILLFDTILQRITSLLRDERTPELRDYQQFMHHLMFVHDLGKYNSQTRTYDGTNHEMRSAAIVSEHHAALCHALQWTPENVTLLGQLTRSHGLLGITRIGEASIVFLSPLLDQLAGLNTHRKRLFLDLLIILTCCDAGASGDFTKKMFYLDDSRITLYERLAHDLLQLSTTRMGKQNAGASSALVAQASTFHNTAVRIKRIVTSNNRLMVADACLEAVLRDMVSKRRFDTRSFACTRFDHGAYVFAPLLMHLERGQTSVSQESLAKLLLLLGILCGHHTTQRVVRFRDSFSMKADLHTQNGQNFSALCDAVEQGDPRSITAVLRSHVKSVTI